MSLKDPDEDSRAPGSRRASVIRQLLADASIKARWTGTGLTPGYANISYDARPLSVHMARPRQLGR